MQEQNAPGIDKYGNEVSNTNAIMAVLHRNTKATAKPEIVCVDCHKGHRASTVVCTGCHQHEDVALPDGWLTYQESESLMKHQFAG